MKNAYYEPDSIDQVSRGLLKELGRHRSRQGFELKPDKAALLVIDMQRYFLEESSHAYIPSGRTILPGIIKMIRAFRNGNRPVFLTRHIDEPGQSSMLSRWWQDNIQRGDKGSEVVPELVYNGVQIIEKSHYDAFHNTYLDQILKENGITQVVITGVMTHLCCETTARAAFMRGYEVYFTVDGTATYALNHQKATLLNLAHGFAVPVLVNDVLTRMED